MGFGGAWPFNPVLARLFAWHNRACVVLGTAFILVSFELGFGANIEGLENTGVHRRNDVHGAIQVGFGNTCFPCVRKAAFHSGLTVPDHGHRQAHEDFFTLTQIGDGVGIAVKLSKVGPVVHGDLLEVSVAVRRLSLLLQAVPGNRVTIVCAAIACNRGLRGDRRSPDDASRFRFELVGDTGMGIQDKRRGVLSGMFGTAINTGIEMRKM